jgi:hypothetical protein
MPDQTAAFVNALVARYGDQAYPFALEQVSQAAAAGMQQSTLLWAKIADGIAALPRATPPIATVRIKRGEGHVGLSAPAVRQLLYISIAARPCAEDDLAAILRTSQDNNVLYSVTGILWSDGKRFMQVLEGPLASVEETYARIMLDERHNSLAIVYDHLVEKRDFGSWSMCHRRSYETDDDYDQKIRRALAAAPSHVRATLDAFIGETSKRTATASWVYDGSPSS